MSAETEEWRSIPSFAPYEASSLGRIRNGSSGYVLRLRTGESLYLCVSLSLQGRNVWRTVHSLVCSAFHGPRPSGLDCAHRDGNGQNNRPDNLRWATRRENEADKLTHGTRRRGSQMWNSKLTEEQVAAIRTEPGLYSDIARKFGVSDRKVAAIKRGERWAHVHSALVVHDNPATARRRGEEHANAKLTAETVRAIRSSVGTLAEIAKRFGTTWQNVHTIRTRRSWTHV